MHETRESWYLAAAKLIESRVFKPAGYELPKFRIGCGWPTSLKAKAEAMAKIALHLGIEYKKYGAF